MVQRRIRENKNIYLLDRILDAEPGIVYIYHLAEKRNTYINRHWLTTFGFSADETRSMGRDINALFHPDDSSHIEQHHLAWSQASEGEIRTIEYRMQDSHGNWHWLQSRETVFARDAEGRVQQILGIATDITDRKRADSLLNNQNRILEKIATGVELGDILDFLVRVIEKEAPGMLCSILLMDAEGVHVRHGSAPSMPPEFVEAINGQAIGPAAGSCGTAAYRKQAVYVEDIEHDPLWHDYSALALSFGLRASWSTPIFDAQGEVLGTFAMYYKHPCLPDQEQIELIRMATDLAAIAIIHDRDAQALHDTQARLLKAQQVAGMGFLEWDLKTNHIYCSDEVYDMYGIDRHTEYTTPDFFTKYVYPDDLALVQERLQLAIQGKKYYDIDHRIQRDDGSILWVHAQAELLGTADQANQVLLGTVIDITQRKLAEEKVKRLTQLYAVLSQCNQAIVRCKDEAELFAEICRDAVQYGGMKLAWIGQLDEASNTVTPVASFGIGINYIQGLDISLDRNKPTGCGPTATAIRENRPYWCQDFKRDPVTAAWRERAREYGWGSSAALPLHCRGKVIGTLNMYSDKPNAFEEDAQNLLVEMTLDISFALDRFASDRERWQVEAALRESEQHLRTIVETEPECVKLISKDGQLLEMNPAGLKMLEAESLEQVAAHGLLNFILSPYREAFIDLHKRVMQGESATLEFEVIGLKGTRRWLGTNAAPMRDEQGQVVSLLGITRDITEQKLAEDRIHYMANYDALTGLPNRNHMADHIKYTLSLIKRSGGKLAVLFIDIDQFKDINETLGHSVGDALLVQIAQRIQHELREEDTAARMGGDEFMVILPDCDSRGAARVAQKLLAMIAEPYQIESYELAVTASIGVAIYPDDGVDLETLSMSADTAMYRAKKESRDAYRFFTSEMEVRAKRNMQLINAMRGALDTRQFNIVYQPLISVPEGNIIGVEALLRWHHPELGLIAPAEFIPVAEESRLILPIGEWVLRAAVDQLQQWRDKGHPELVMAVNLSAVQFRHAGLPELVMEILDNAGVPSHCLELELTEGVAMQDPLGEFSVMNKLHERSIRLSIDDFGTGYSSLSYLKKFQVYKLKIDKSFVSDINTDTEDRAIVAAIIGMAKNLGLKTIAEGVETAEQLAYLVEQGCDEAQGYYFSQPLPAEQLESLLSLGKMAREHTSAPDHRTPPIRH